MYNPNSFLLKCQLDVLTVSCVGNEGNLIKLQSPYQNSLLAMCTKSFCNIPVPLQLVKNLDKINIISFLFIL